MMSLILQVFGVLFILVSAVGGYLLYRLYRFLKRIHRQAQDESDLDTPSRVTLIEANHPDWT